MSQSVSRAPKNLRSLPAHGLSMILCFLMLCACIDAGPSLSKRSEPPPERLQPGQFVPSVSEAAVVGRVSQPITRDSSKFAGLIRSHNPAIVFKDEEGSGADRLMSQSLSNALDRLAILVADEWPGIKLRVTEAWDEEGEHSPASSHYEGRAADLTTSDLDRGKLGRLAGLAVKSGFDWVYYEHSHVHASVSK